MTVWNVNTGKRIKDVWPESLTIYSYWEEWQASLIKKTSNLTIYLFPCVHGLPFWCPLQNNEKGCLVQYEIIYPMVITRTNAIKKRSKLIHTTTNIVCILVFLFNKKKTTLILKITMVIREWSKKFPLHVKKLPTATVT